MLCEQWYLETVTPLIVVLNPRIRRAPGVDAAKHSHHYTTPSQPRNAPNTPTLWEGAVARSRAAASSAGWYSKAYQEHQRPTSAQVRRYRFRMAPHGPSTRVVLPRVRLLRSRSFHPVRHGGLRRVSARRRHLVLCVFKRSNDLADCSPHTVQGRPFSIAI